MKETHARKARLGDLGGANRIIGARCLAAALRIQPRVALAKVHEASLHPVGNAEIKMPSVRALEEARGTEVLVGTALVDIGPEGSRRLGHTRLARQIFAAFDERRREAEIETEQGRLLFSALQKPSENFHSRPDMPGPDQARRCVSARLRYRDTFVPFALRSRPVDRDVRRELPHLGVLGRALGLAATKSRDRWITSRTRSLSLLS